MRFIETPVFTRQICENMSDDDYAALQAWLSDHPESGDLIPGGGGLRKLRWSGSGRGKRGGSRVIYYFWRPETILMMLSYLKNELADISPAQLKTLAKFAKENLHE